ncbi:hypothetical protein LINGRAHAP2_LOCUS31856 [Linum grandiflorum]
MLVLKLEAAEESRRCYVSNFEKFAESGVDESRQLVLSMVHLDLK